MVFGEEGFLFQFTLTSHYNISLKHAVLLVCFASTVKNPKLLASFYLKGTQQGEKFCV